jgi:hypothetical protein
MAHLTTLSVAQTAQSLMAGLVSTEKNVGGSSCGLILSQDLSGGTQENHENL